MLVLAPGCLITSVLRCPHAYSRRNFIDEIVNYFQDAFVVQNGTYGNRPKQVVVLEGSEWSSNR